MSNIATLRARSIVVARRAALALDIEIRRRPRPLLDGTVKELRPDIEMLAAQVMLARGEQLTVVQVGAFDGVTNDPVHDLIVKHKWTGVLVEPQPRIFRRLEETYAGNDRVSLRQVAISDRVGSQPLYTVDREGTDLPEIVDQMATFDKASILAHRIYWPDIEEHIVATDVPTITFEELLEGTDHVDVLQVDAEGFDGEIIRLFDFARWQPSIVHFEHRHVPRDAHAAAVRRLGDHGYRVWIDEFDTLAYRG